MQRILRKNTGSITWYIPEGEEHTLGDKLTDLNDPIGEETATIHKKGRRKVFASLGTTTNGEEIYVKAFRLSSLSLKLKHLFLRSKALRELMIGLTALERGVPVIVPLAAGEKRRMGLIVECYTLLKKIDSAVTLRDYLYREGVPQHQRSRVIEALGRLARKSHEGGILQTDFALNNFLLKDPNDPSPTVYIIDFERTYVYNYIPEKMRNWTLAKLNRIGPDFSITDKLRFLKAYSTGNDANKSPLLPWMKELDRHTNWILRKDAQRIHKACVQGGRGYKLYTDGHLRAYFLEGHNAEELIRLTKDIDKEKEGAMEIPGPFKLYKTCRKIHIKDTEIEVDIFKFLPRSSQYSSPSVSTRPAVEAWQAANALTKANLPVSQVIGAIEVDEGASYRGYLIIKCIPGLKDLRTAIGESQPRSERRRVLLWHTARLLARLHNHGTLSAPISAGDIGVQEPSSGRIQLYLTRPFKFTLAPTTATDSTGLEDGNADLNKLEAFLVDLMDGGDVELLKKFYRLHSSNIPSHGETPSSYTPGRWSMIRFP